MNITNGYAPTLWQHQLKTSPASRSDGSRLFGEQTNRKTVSRFGFFAATVAEKCCAAFESYAISQSAGWFLIAAITALLRMAGLGRAFIAFGRTCGLVARTQTFIASRIGAGAESAFAESGTTSVFFGIGRLRTDTPRTLQLSA